MQPQPWLKTDTFYFSRTAVHLNHWLQERQDLSHTICSQKGLKLEKINFNKLGSKLKAD